MSNLKRYSVVIKGTHNLPLVAVEDENGTFVKFEDIKVFLPSASDNSHSKEICPLCKCDGVPSTYYCPECDITFNLID